VGGLSRIALKKVQKFRSSEVQKFRSSEVQKFRSSEVQKFRIILNFCILLGQNPLSIF
jgi:hypothetical protein